MNPCPCGKPEDPPEGCSNPNLCCNRYQSKISGPLLDRIDIHLRVEALSLQDLAKPNNKSSESSAFIRQRVQQAFEAQQQRANKANHHLSAKEVEIYCPLTNKDQSFITRAADKMALSARAYHRVLKVARTIADLENQPHIHTKHLSEALSYRAIF